MCNESLSPSRRQRSFDSFGELGFNVLITGVRAPISTGATTVTSTCTLATPPTKRKSKKTRGHGRFTSPVPPPRPDEILPPRRGRNARQSVIQAEHFRKYIYLRRQLKPWSDSFRTKYGRTPSLLDVHQANVPGLLDRFVEYLEALDRLRS